MMRPIILREEVKCWLLAPLRIQYRFGLWLFINRGELPYILNARRLVGKGAEVGVKLGQYSEYLLEHWKGALLYSIDPWREFDTTIYRDEDNVKQSDHDRFYQITQSRLSRFGPRSKILRMTSAEAAQKIDDESLDFVYLDARHDYESVREDLALWYPKIKAGGILSGHDYLEGRIGDTIFGVKPAVDEFVRANDLRLYVSLREPVYKSWLFFKPRA